MEWLIETHVHADHLSRRALHPAGKLGGKIGIGENITVVQDTFGKVFNEGTEFQRDGIAVRPRSSRTATPTPSATCACRDAHARPHARLHDACRWATPPSSATPSSCPTAARPAPTSPAATPGTLYDSHPEGAEPARRDAPLHVPRLRPQRPRDPRGRPRWARRRRTTSTSATARRSDEFVKFRTERDAQLAMPRLIIPSLQVNMRARRAAAGGGRRQADAEGAGQQASEASKRRQEAPTWTPRMIDRPLAVARRRSPPPTWRRSGARASGPSSATARTAKAPTSRASRRSRPRRRPRGWRRAISPFPAAS